jgi:hypothetical protein
MGFEWQGDDRGPYCVAGEMLALSQTAPNIVTRNVPIRLSRGHELAFRDDLEANGRASAYLPFVGTVRVLE